MSKLQKKVHIDVNDAQQYRIPKQLEVDNSPFKSMCENTKSTTQDTTSFEYNMDHKHRGVAIIFNHYEYNDPELHTRKGTEKDVEALQKCLPLLGFESENIIVQNDLRRSQILTYSYKLSVEKEKILENCDCIVVFVLTHGARGNKIYARDDDYDVFQLVEQFTPNNFIELAAKPKLFFINACRGGSSEDEMRLKNKSIYYDDSSDGLYDQQSFSHPLYPDILISMSSHHELVSFRNQSGSWYIQDLCYSIKLFTEKNKLDTTDITEILLYTNYLVSQRKPFTGDMNRYMGRKQVPCYSSTLCRKLYFKPKK